MKKYYQLKKGALVELDGYKIWGWPKKLECFFWGIIIGFGISVISNLMFIYPPCHCTGVRTEQAGVIWPDEIRNNQVKEDVKIKEGKR